MGSLDGVYIAIARFIQAHGPQPGWYPYWRCGIPFEQVYQPIFHAIVAAFSSASGFTTARGYHWVVGAVYCLGPVSLFWLTARLTSNLPTGFVAALIYSLLSPSALLVPAIAGDLGGLYWGRRLHVALVYSDTPNLAALTLLPLVILLLDVARRRSEYWPLILAAFLTAAILLTNVPASIALGMAMAAYALAFATPRFWWQIGAVGLAGGLMAVGWFPPSMIRAVSANLSRYEPANRFTANHYAGFAAAAFLLPVLAILARKINIAEPARFAGFFLLFAGGVTLLNYWFDVTILAQPRRFQIAMEIPIAILLAIGGIGLWKRIQPVPVQSLKEFGWMRVALLAGGVLFLGFEIQSLRFFARKIIRPIDGTYLSEYRTAKWLEQNAPGQRVYAAGSTMFWMNAFADIPQVTGCCEQSIALPVTQMMRYTLGTDDEAGDRTFAVSLAWLQVLGANYVVVPGPQSTDVYKWDWKHPAKFDGRLREITREGGNIVYEVPQRSAVPAHLVLRNELISRYPINGLDVEPLARYNAAIQDAGRAAVFMENGADPRVYEFRVELAAHQLFSVQIPFHAGWRATVNGHAVPVAQDALGFVVVEPGTIGPARIRLTFADWPEQSACRAISGLTIAGLLVGLVIASVRRFR